MSVAPVAFCVQCNKPIYQFIQDWDEDNIEGEPQFCCLKCKEEYLKVHGELPHYWNAGAYWF